MLNGLIKISNWPNFSQYGLLLEIETPWIPVMSHKDETQTDQEGESLPATKLTYWRTIISSQDTRNSASRS
jgi:hypothetical protein